MEVRHEACETWFVEVLNRARLAARYRALGVEEPRAAAGLNKLATRERAVVAALLDAGMKMAPLRATRSMI
jgi:hypothetical protein